MIRGGLLVLLLAGCHDTPHHLPTAPPALPDGSAGAASSILAHRSPRTQKQLPTTGGAITMDNLEAHLAQALAGIDGHPQPPPSPQLLASGGRLLMEHGRLVGRIAECERGAELLEQAAAATPLDPRALLARADARAAFHRFQDALADLDRAGQLGGDARAIERQRVGIYQALGRYAEARPIRERMARESVRLETLGALATLDADEGKLDEAERHFDEAADHFPDVSAVPVAWLWLQQGTMWQKAGHLARSRELLEEAHARLPRYAAVTSHLAAGLELIREHEAAAALLRPLVAESDDPEFAGQLSTVLRSLGDGAGAARLEQQAKVRYEELVARHPAAYADHAARFLIATSQDPARALALAEQNLAVRKTPDAASLVVEAALAANRADRACEAAELALTVGPRIWGIHTLAWKAFNACGKKDRANQALADGQAQAQQ